MLKLVAICLFFLVAALAVAVVALRAIAGGRFYLKFRGKRLVTCPETERTAAVEVDAWGLAKEIALGGGTLLQSRLAQTKLGLRVRECSRWPEGQDCPQECLHQIEAAPEQCLVRHIVDQWYAERPCVFCQRPIREIDWLELGPALLTPDHKTVHWNQVPPEKLPDVLQTYSPVCWSCRFAEGLPREHPDRVVSR
ncbi:MAG: hypothetical protein ACLQOO_02000 [Terriglobia bacterium]